MLWLCLLCVIMFIVCRYVYFVLFVYVVLFVFLQLITTYATNFITKTQLEALYTHMRVGCIVRG